MAERPPYLEPVNAALSLGIAVLLLGAGLAALGPGRVRVAQLHGSVRERSAEIEDWLGRRESLQPLTDGERREWQLQWQELGALPSEVPEPALVARVARVFQRPSVQGLEIEKLRPSPNGPKRIERTFESPVGGREQTLVGEPVRVRFRARYEDVLGLLRHFELGGFAARIESLELRRAYPHVAVDLRLLVFARREATS